MYKECKIFILSVFRAVIFTSFYKKNSFIKLSKRKICLIYDGK